jgi:SAM-dependent methyltransferase
MKSEIHLFIIWFNAVKKIDDIFADLQQRFEILGVYIVRWSEKHFSDNMSRFYGTNLPDGSFKEKHCGRGPFYLVVVRDPAPNYDLRKTSAAVERVNINMFDAKQRYRQITGGGHRIHATNSPQETDHDLMLLLQQDQQDFIEAHPSIWKGHAELIEADLPGADGWESMQQVFRVLNATIPYVVLRNFEGLPQQYTLEHHGDVDLLCNNMQNMRFITNARPVFNQDYRVLHQVDIGNEKVLFDFRNVGDKYYDTPWEKDILIRRVLSENGFFRPCEKDYFWTLLYHAFVHKPSFSRDYIDRLCPMSKGIIDLIPDDLANPQKIKSNLDTFLTANGYQYSEPIDLSVYFNTTAVGQMKLSLNRILATSKTMGAALNRLFTQTEDCSTDTPEFTDEIYRTHSSLRRHFSPRRYALIKSIPLNGVRSVLEIGAESGILTRYLGDRFERVVALESNPDLAQAAAARCRDLKSVSVQSFSPELFDIEERFDFVVFTCDCASWTHQGATLATITTLLNKAIGSLKQGGLLLFAVDNPLVKSGIFSATPSLPADINANDEVRPTRSASERSSRFFHKKRTGKHTALLSFPKSYLAGSNVHGGGCRAQIKVFWLLGGYSFHRQW